MGDLRNIVLYVSGPYRGDVDKNIAAARAAAIELWELGYAVICPHLNTANFQNDCHIEDGEYILGDLEILKRCDGMIMLPGWETSEGACAEMRHAVDLNMKVTSLQVIKDLTKFAAYADAVLNDTLDEHGY